ncbi:MAG: glycoside hydrolase family 3 C-terminal domain-containing protein [Polyangiales bacterium]
MTRPSLRGLSLDQKLSLLEGVGNWESRAVPEIGLRALFFADGPHGVRKAKTTASSGLGDAEPATCFPAACALASTWDLALISEVGVALGREARALGVDVLLGPGMNLKRNPLGGRNFEYFSEDPLLSGELAAAMVRGIQSAGVGACIKHFAANNQEDHRMVVDVSVDERTLRELYLRGFEIAVSKGRPRAVMGAYNRINGTYACEHRELLDGVLRREWGFDGIVISDWGAISDRVAGVAAGLDLAMPTSNGAYHPELRRALADGRLDEAQIDACATRLVELQERIAREPCTVDRDAHHALARRVASAGCVLLKNEHGLLPLDGGRIALIGAFAKTPRYQGAGSSGVVPTRLSSIHDAFAQTFADRFIYAAGHRIDDSDDPALIARAVAAAREADVAVVVAGLPAAYESEAFDRAHMDLPRAQQALIAAVAKACPRVVVVLCNGAPVTMPWADEVEAIVEAYLGGQAGGEGVVDVLSGAVNPSGKLAETFAHRLEDHASTAFFPGDGQRVEYREGLFVGYRHFDTKKLDVLFPFGHGLSYTTFALSDLEVTRAGDDVELAVTVENTGARHGAEVVQVYVHDVEHTVVRPEQELATFARVELAPGAHTRIALRLDRRAFAFWDARRRRFAVEAGAFELRVGTSSRDIRLRARIDVASEDGPFEPEAPPIHSMAMKTPVRPFTRQSTLGQVRITPLGELLFRGARADARRRMARGGDPDLVRFADAMVNDLPLRALVTLAGSLGWDQLDALVELLNGRPLRAVRRLVARR